MHNLQQLIVDYCHDTENAEINYEIAKCYYSLGHTAAALSFFLRAAERTENKLLAYECMLYVGFCFEKQGNRVNSVRGAYKHAICILPDRPEAYYFISKINEEVQWYIESYTYAELGLTIAKHENLEPLRSNIGYSGKHGFLFNKAISSWYWGKVEQCKDLFLELSNNHWDNLSDYEKDIVEKSLKNSYNIEIKYLLRSNYAIPVIGVPVVNGVHWLKRLIESVDYPVKDLVIINNNGRGQFDEELNQLANIKHEYIERIKVTHLPSNIGCSGAWNLIIKSYMNSPYWIIANNDICFTPGMLKRMYEEAKNTDSGMIHAKRSDWGGGAYDLFLIKDFVVQACGLFDENLYPIYAEDVDYHIRVKNENIKSSYLDIEYLHGEKDYATSGSQTWRLDTNLKEKMNKGRILNESDYLTKKWGPNYQSMNTYSTPFNKTEYDSRFTTYDLSFVRRKHLGF